MGNIRDELTTIKMALDASNYEDLVKAWTPEAQADLIGLRTNPAFSKFQPQMMQAMQAYQTIQSRKGQGDLSAQYKLLSGFITQALPLLPNNVGARAPRPARVEQAKPPTKNSNSGGRAA